MIFQAFPPIPLFTIRHHLYFQAHIIFNRNMLKLILLTLLTVLAFTNTLTAAQIDQIRQDEVNCHNFKRALHENTPALILDSILNTQAQ